MLVSGRRLSNSIKCYEIAIKYHKNISWNCGTKSVVVVHIVVDVTIVVHAEWVHVVVVAIEVVRRKGPSKKQCENSSYLE